MKKLPVPDSKRITKNERLSVKELTSFMKLNGLTSREFAEILGVTEQAVKLWESGERQFSITNSRLIRIFIKYPQLLKEF